MGESGNGRDVNTWKWRGTDSGRPLQYSTNEIIIVFTPAPTSCSYSSISHPHRSMGFFRNQTFTLVISDSTRPTDYSVFDSRVVFTPAPTPWSCSSLSHAHRSMGFFHNQTFALEVADSPRPIDYSVSASRVVCPCGRRFSETYWL